MERGREREREGEREMEMVGGMKAAALLAVVERRDERCGSPGGTGRGDARGE